MEVWKDIEGYNGLYSVSNCGNVRRNKGYQAKEARLLKHLNNGKDYLGVGLTMGSKKSRTYIHRLVAAAFIDNPYNKPHVNHKDGNRLNNHVDNLEWVTISENHLHRYRVLGQLGVNHGKSGKLKGAAKKVLCVLNGCKVAVFNSHLHASRVLGINDRALTDASRFGKELIGYKWQRI